MVNSAVVELTKRTGRNTNLTGERSSIAREAEGDGHAALGQVAQGISGCPTLRTTFSPLGELISGISGTGSEARPVCVLSPTTRQLAYQKKPTSLMSVSRPKSPRRSEGPVKLSLPCHLDRRRRLYLPLALG